MSAQVLTFPDRRHPVRLMSEERGEQWRRELQLELWLAEYGPAEILQDLARVLRSGNRPDWRALADRIDGVRESV